MRPMFPGGLRAQLLLGLTVLLVASSALAALVVENVITRRLLESRRQHVTAIAAVASGMSDASRQATVDAGVVDALVVRGQAFGPPAVVKRLRSTEGDGAQFIANGVRYIRVQRGEVQLAAGVDDVRADVATARSMLFLFGVLVAVVVLALGYGFLLLIVIRPIRAIGVATERAAHGDLASAISLIPRNEIGRVAASFNEMLRGIDRNREELESKVAEQQRTNEELSAAQNSLVRSEKLASVGHLAAGVAHEIGNPLAALSGYNELLLDGMEPDEVEDLLLRSGEQLDRIRTVIRNLLDFSRDERDAEPAPTDIARCVAETISLVSAGSRSQNVAFFSENLDGPPVDAVASQVVQVLVNLAMNAVDALAEGGGRVTFRREAADGFVRLLVQDDGPGVPEGLQSRVFDPFFTTKDPGQGTGLGLAISARIVESFGGELTLESQPGGGACFVLRMLESGGG